MSMFSNFAASEIENDIVSGLVAEFARIDAEKAITTADVAGLVIKCAEMLEDVGLNTDAADGVLEVLESEFLTPNQIAV